MTYFFVHYNLPFDQKKSSICEVILKKLVRGLVSYCILFVDCNYGCVSPLVILFELLISSRRLDDTAASTKIVPQARKSVRDNTDWYYR